MFIFRENCEKPIFLYGVAKNLIFQFSRKTSILGHMLLYKSNMNVAIKKSLRSSWDEIEKLEKVRELQNGRGHF